MQLNCTLVFVWNKLVPLMLLGLLVMCLLCKYCLLWWVTFEFSLFPFTVECWLRAFPPSPQPKRVKKKKEKNKIKEEKTIRWIQFCLSYSDAIYFNCWAMLWEMVIAHMDHRGTAAHMKILFLSMMRIDISGLTSESLSVCMLYGFGFCGGSEDGAWFGFCVWSLTIIGPRHLQRWINAFILGQVS